VSNLEPDLGQSTAITQPNSAPTITPTSTPSALAPKLPTDLQAKIQANLNQTQQPATVQSQQPAVTPDTTGLDTNAIILNLPNARKSFVAKYERLGGAVRSLPQPVRETLVQMDYDRVQKGQAPLNDQETIAAIVTAIKHKPSTPPKEKGLLGEIMSLPSNAVSDATNILTSIPSMLQPNRDNAFWKEANAVVPFYKLLPGGMGPTDALGAAKTLKGEFDKRRAEGDNVIEALAKSPGIRLLPGSFTVGNLANGKEGLKDIAKHPVGTALDVLPIANKVAGATEIGKLAEAEKLADISKTTPIRAVLGKKILPEGETTITGSRLVPGKLGLVTKPISTSLESGELGRIFGHRARQTATTLNVGDVQFTDILKGTRPLTDPGHQLVRDSWRMWAEKAPKEYGLDQSRIRTITDALETDRSMLDNPTAFSDAERAFAADAIKLQQRFQEHLTGSNRLMEIGGEIYDMKSVGKLRKMVDVSGKLQAKVDENLATKVGEARKVLEDRLAQDGRLSTVDKHVYDRIVPLSDMMDDYFGNPNSTVKIADLEKASRGLTSQKTRLGGAGEVGKRAAPGGDIRIDTLARIRGELKAAAKQEAKIEKFMAKAPDRWHPNIQRLARHEGEQLLIQNGVDPKIAADIIAERDWEAYPGIMNKAVMDKLIKDAEPMWQTLKAAGIDPVYVHRVPMGRTRILELPRLTDYVSRVGQTERRSLLDPTPYTHDITVGLAHQGAELAAQELSRQVLDSVGREMGVREGALLERVMPEARRRAALDATKDPLDIANELIRESYEPYNPNTLIDPQIRVIGQNPDQVWIPKMIARNIQDYYHPKIGKIITTMKPITGIFRTAVLPLSPRWQINNTIGGAIVTAITEPRAFLELRNAFKAKAEFMEGGTNLPDNLGFSLGTARKELEFNRRDIADWEKGNRVAKLAEGIKESKVGRAGHAFTQGAYDLNSAVDDMYRISTYLSTEKRLLGKGADAMAAKAAGLEAVNRYFQNWNALTPVERNLLREVFPFYAFTSYAMRFVMEYPGTHPLRASIMSNMAEAELRDMNESLPPEMMDYLALSGQNEHGDQSFISLRGLNPFADTANQFTIKGFLSGLNPVGQAVAKSVGADLGQGGYLGRPVYDAQTGKLTDSKPGFVESLIGSTVPQIQFLQRKLGMDPEFNALLRTNPEAAQRLLVSGVGIPTIYRNMNIPEIEMKSELARLTSQRNALKTALETGDYSDAMKWPNLREQVRQIQQLRDSGQLTAYNPQAGADNSLTGAIKSVVPWPT